MSKLRVFLADDHAIVREGLKAVVNAQPDLEVVGEAGDGDAAVRGVRDFRPDVVVLDVSMPRLSGAQVAAALKHERPELVVLALTVHNDTSYLRALLEAGVSGYVLKRAAADELVQAIRTVARGGTYLDPSLAGRVVGGYVRIGGQATPASDAALSEREEQVLRLVATGLSNKEVAARLGVGLTTVESYKSRAAEKLGFSSRVEIIRYALQKGWLTEG